MRDYLSNNVLLLCFDEVDKNSDLFNEVMVLKNRCSLIGIDETPYFHSLLSFSSKQSIVHFPKLLIFHTEPELQQLMLVHPTVNHVIGFKKHIKKETLDLLLSSILYYHHSVD